MLGTDRDRQRLAHEIPTRATCPSATAARSASRCPSVEARIVDPDTVADCAPGEHGELWFRGPAAHGGLLRARAPRRVHARRLVPHRRRLRVDDDGFFYFQRPARRHDQDRGRERVAARGRGRPARRHRRALADRLRARRTPSGARSSPRCVVGADHDARPRRAARRRSRAQALGVQGAAPVVAPAPHGRGADAVERQARHARARRS